MSRVRFGAVVLAGAGMLLPAQIAAQDAEAPSSRIVAKQLSISQKDASLQLELDDGRALEITFRDGTVRIDGESVGDFERGDPLESAWRRLLSSTVDASDGPLAALLTGWSSPDDLEGAAGRTASLLDATLEEFVAGGATAPEAPAAPAANASATASADATTARRGAQLGIPVRELLRSPELLDLLDKLGDLDLDLDELRSSIGEDLIVHQGETIEGDVFVFDGDLDVRGEIEGNVVVADGRVRLFEEGIINGDLRLSDATFHDYGGTLVGRRSRVRASRSDEFDRIRDELRSELRSEIRDELESELHDSNDWRRRGGSFNPFRHFWAGLMGLFETVLTFGILAAAGAVMLYFQPERLAAVADTARTSTMKSAAVGLAGAFLFVPVWVIGMVVLTISIVGIPALLLWVPLLPLAAGLAALFGLFGVMTVVGEWAQRRNFRFMEWADDPNAFYRMVSGLLVVSALFGGAHVLRMGGPLLGFFHGLLGFIACLVAIGAVLTGFGAALLTLSHRRSIRFNNDFGDDWTWREWARPSSWKRGASGAAASAADAAAKTSDDVTGATSEAAKATEEAAEETIEDIQDALDDLGDDLTDD